MLMKGIEELILLPDQTAFAFLVEGHLVMSLRAKTKVIINLLFQITYVKIYNQTFEVIAQIFSQIYTADWPQYEILCQSQDLKVLVVTLCLEPLPDHALQPKCPPVGQRSTPMKVSNVITVY